MSSSHPMPTRRLGAHGPDVGVVGFGCMALSGIYGEADEQESAAVVRAAVDAGATLIDTSDSYGNGHNEELVGSALVGRREEVVLATKFGHQSDGLGRPEYVRRAIDASLRRLGVDHVDIYYLHRVDQTTPVQETIGAMSELVDAGKVRHLGMSEVRPETLEAAHAVHPITVVQQEYSLFSRDLEIDLLPTMRRLGVGLVAYSPLGRGMLTGTYRRPADVPADDPRRSRYPRYGGENLERNLGLAQPLFDLADRLGIPATSLALGWVLAQGEDVVAIPGTRRGSHLASNVSAAYRPLSEDVVEELSRSFPVGSAVGDRYNAQMARRLDR